MKKNPNRSHAIDDVENKRIIVIATGYIKEIEPYDDIYKDGLIYRNAIIFNPYYKNRETDYEFYFQFITSLLNISDFDMINVKSIIFYIEGERVEKELFSINEFNDYVSSYSEGDYIPALDILLYKDNVLTYMIITELWNHLGGPYPYSDSITLAIFSLSDISEKLIEMSKMVCDSYNADLHEIVRGDPLKAPVPRWKKVLLKIFKFFSPI